VKQLVKLFVAMACILGCASQVSFAQGVAVTAGASGGTGDGFLMGTHTFFYSDNSSLGGDTLRDGSATYMRFDAQYNWQQYFSGIGFFYESDSFGEDQKDTIMGVVVEIVMGSFFVKIMPGFIDQEFQGRSFSKRNGSFMAFEPGIRGDLYAGTLFYEVAFQQRTQTINEEDSRSMLAEYKRTETMPMLGLGVNL